MNNSVNDTNTNYPTDNGDGQSIILDGPSDTDTQTVISNGTWDNIDLNGHTAYVYVNIGAAINGDGGILTENNAANSGAYLYGNYAGLYATLINQSTANVTLTGSANIVNDSTRTNIDGAYAAKITGVNAYLTIDASSTGASEITGTYNSLNYADVKSNNTINANGNGDNYLGEDQGTINFVQGNGTLTINGINDTTGINNFTGSGNESNVTLTGNNETGNINRIWNNINGNINGNININNATFNNASIYNTKTTNSITINGTGNGDITYNGVSNAQGYIKGTWKNIIATIQNYDKLNAISTQSTNITIDSGTVNNLQDTSSTDYNNITLNGGSYLNATLKYGTNTINTNTADENNNNNRIALTLGNNTTELNVSSGTFGSVNAGAGQLNINYNIGNNKEAGSITIENTNENTTKIILQNINNSTISTNGNGGIFITHGGITDIIALVGAQTATLARIVGTNNDLVTFTKT